VEHLKHHSLHPIVDKICTPLVLVNHDETNPYSVREDSAAYIDRLYKILSPETESINQAKAHAWNVLVWMIEDYSKTTEMPTSHATHFRLKHAMYLIVQEFDYPDLPKDALDALKLNEAMYKLDLKEQDEQLYRKIIDGFNG